MADKPIPTPIEADLPEDWQLDQIVSPTGTDVGLTEQHGYNYLMEKVNEVATGVNTVNDGFENIPDNDEIAEIIEPQIKDAIEKAEEALESAELARVFGLIGAINDDEDAGGSGGISSLIKVPKVLTGTYSAASGTVVFEEPFEYPPLVFSFNKNYTSGNAGGTPGGTILPASITNSQFTFSGVSTNYAWVAISRAPQAIGEDMEYVKIQAGAQTGSSGSIVFADPYDEPPYLVFPNGGAFVANSLTNTGFSFTSGNTNNMWLAIGKTKEKLPDDYKVCRVETLACLTTSGTIAFNRVWSQTPVGFMWYRGAQNGSMTMANILIDKFTYSSGTTERVFIFFSKTPETVSI